MTLPCESCGAPRCDWASKGEVCQGQIQCAWGDWHLSSEGMVEGGSWDPWCLFEGRPNPEEEHVCETHRDLTIPV
jgi:hypothetical protein